MKKPWLIGTAVVAMALTGYAQDAGSNYENALDEATTAEEFAPLFPFKITHGAPDNITNVQTWNAPWPPAGQDGFVKAVDSQFIDNRGSRYFTGGNGPTAQARRSVPLPLT